MKISTNYYQNQQKTKFFKANHRKSPQFKSVDVKLGINAIKDLEPAEKLVLMAHPDDETCFFGFLPKFMSNKDSVQLVYTTSGQNGRDLSGQAERYSPKVRDIRLKELQNVMNAINASRSPLVLDLMDGETHFPHNRGILLGYIKEIIDKVDPKEVYSFDSSGITGHTDHFTVGNLTEMALEDVDKEKTIKYWNVGLTQEGTDKLIMDTIRTTNMFRNSRASIKIPDKIIDITRNLPELIESFSLYVSQFTREACRDIEKFYKSYPYINLKLIK